MSLGSETESGFTWYHDTFTMPDHAVIVTAVQEDTEKLNVNLCAGATVDISMQAYMQLDREVNMVYDAQTDASLIDLNNSGTPDVSITIDYDFDGEELTAIHYYARLLANSDAKGAYTYSFNMNSDKYSAITFMTPQVGDVNLDGHLTIRDVTAIQRHIAELESIPEQYLILADTNGDGEINIADATHLQMYLAEYDVKLG